MRSHPVRIFSAVLMTAVLLVPCHFVNRGRQYLIAQLSAGVLRKSGLEAKMKQLPILFTRADPADFPHDGNRVLTELHDITATWMPVGTESVRVFTQLKERYGEPDAEPPFAVRYGFTLKATRGGQTCLILAAEWKGAPAVLGEDDPFAAEAARAVSSALFKEQYAKLKEEN